MTKITININIINKNTNSNMNGNIKTINNNSSAMQETWVRSLGWEDTLEGTNSRITKAEDRKSEVEDRMIEKNETELKKGK